MDTKIIKITETVLMEKTGSEDVTFEDMVAALSEAGDIIRAGGLVAFPTETVYGLGGNAMDPEAAARIYAAKGRPSDNPLIAHISDMGQLEILAASVPEKARMLAERYWPGPLTLIFEKKPEVPDATTGGLNTVAVRFPAHPVAQALIEAAGVPVAAPSANISGRPSPTTAAHVIEDMTGRIDMIIDGGSADIGLESTIVDCTGETPMVLRPGYITADMVAEVCGSVDFDKVVTATTKEEAATPEGPKAPGMKYRHYSPTAPMTLFTGDAEDVAKAIIRRASKDLETGLKVGVLVSEETKGTYQVALSGRPDHVADGDPWGEAVIRSLGSAADVDAVASQLFAALRDMDSVGAQVIYAETFSEEGVGAAIMNRMRKAAGFDIVRVEPEVRQIPEEEAPELRFSKVIFVGRSNATMSVICESIFSFLCRDKGIGCDSCGVSVLFPEPVNDKAVDILAMHGLTALKTETRQIESGDFDEQTLVLAMDTTVKNRVTKAFPEQENVYTLSGFVGDPTEPEMPVGDKSEYEAAYQTLLTLVSHVVDRLMEQAERDAKSDAETLAVDEAQPEESPAANDMEQLEEENTDTDL